MEAGAVWQLGESGRMDALDTSAQSVELRARVEHLLDRIAANSRITAAEMGTADVTDVPSGYAFQLALAPLDALIGTMRLARERKYRLLLKFLQRLYQGDLLDVVKGKMILPLRKGNSENLSEYEFVADQEATDLYAQLLASRAELQGSPAIQRTIMWTPRNEGHLIVLEPNGTARAWPVYDAPDLWEDLGNVLEEPVTEIWERYRFKENHVTKYVGTSILATA
ncbi:hypothetical protein ABZX85_47165 [Streptomyces sp. NPDC004539]|uniref:hypothetical protein n=1 Tax=Streptomyces sp. NPDC004539 TaxID=3154280 RepID=UPI0033AB263E